MEDLIGWGQELGFAEVEPGQGELVRLADERVGFAIAERQELVAVEISRRDGDGELLGAFDDVEDARRFLALELGVLHRGRSALPQLRATATPPGYVLEETPTSLWLSWLTGSAEFPADYFSRRRAVMFSRVERAEVLEIHGAVLEPRGRPLFDEAA